MQMNRGSILMKKALQLSLPCNTPIKELQDTVLVYSTIIANMKHQITKLKKENECFKNAILTMQANSAFTLKGEALEAYEYLNEHMREMDRLLELFKMNGNSVNVDFVIEYNAAIQNGLIVLIQLISRTINHEDFDLIAEI